MKFRLDKKLIVKVRYYQELFYITDDKGEQIFVGSDEKRAREILAVLETYYFKKEKRRGKAHAVRKTPQKRNRKAGKKGSRR